MSLTHPGFIRPNFAQYCSRAAMKDPDAMDATLEQLKKDAPAEWSFRSLEELADDDDQADWWKEEEPE